MSVVSATIWCVRDLGLLAGVDDIRWQDLSHAYGAADDVPTLLHAVASGSVGADEAISELYGSICHQGSVYSATPYAVPFLARLAVAGIHTVALLGLLGWIADSDDERGLEVAGAARAAVADQVGELTPLLADPDAEVRVLAVWALAQCRTAAGLAGLLRRRWDSETHPSARAAVLKALTELDPPAAAGLAADVLAGSGDAGLRLIAAAACAAAGVGWSDRLHEAATAWMAGGDLLPGFFWGDRDPFADLVIALAARGDPDASLRLVVTGLTSPVTGDVRKQVVWVAGELADSYRSPAAGLVAPLAAVAGDDTAGGAAIGLLRRLIGVPATVGEFAAVADRLVAVADARGPGRQADQALACLIELGDPRAAGLLGRDLPHRPFALDAAASAGRGQPARPLSFDPALFEAVREWLRAGALDHNSLVFLLTLLREWGSAAAAAIPEVLAFLPSNPLGAGVLAAIGGQIPAAASALKQVAAVGPVHQRLSAGSTLRTLTGDSEPLLAAIEYGLHQRGYDLQDAARAAQELGAEAERLVPALAAALQATTGSDTTAPDIDARVQLALVLWRHTGDPAPVIPVLAQALSPDQSRFTSWTAIHAADAAAMLGPAARSLLPAILAMLDNPAVCPAAVQALLRIDPGSYGGADTGLLADRLVTAVGTDAGSQQQAVAALGELGLARLPPAAAGRLRQLAEQDERIIRSGLLTSIVRNDEALRAAIRQLLAQQD